MTVKTGPTNSLAFFKEALDECITTIRGWSDHTTTAGSYFGIDFSGFIDQTAAISS